MSSANRVSQRGFPVLASRAHEERSAAGADEARRNIDHGAGLPGSGRRLHQDIRVDRPGAHQVTIDHNPPLDGRNAISPDQTAIFGVEAIHPPIARTGVDLAFPKRWRGEDSPGRRIVPQFGPGLSIQTSEDADGRTEEHAIAHADRLRRLRLQAGTRLRSSRRTADWGSMSRSRGLCPEPLREEEPDRLLLAR